MAENFRKSRAMSMKGQSRVRIVEDYNEYSDSDEIEISPTSASSYRTSNDEASTGAKFVESQKFSITMDELPTKTSPWSTASFTQNNDDDIGNNSGSGTPKIKSLFNQKQSLNSETQRVLPGRPSVRIQSFNNSETDRILSDRDAFGHDRESMRRQLESYNSIVRDKPQTTIGIQVGIASWDWLSRLEQLLIHFFLIIFDSSADFSKTLMEIFPVEASTQIEDIFHLLLQADPEMYENLGHLVGLAEKWLVQWNSQITKKKDILEFIRLYMIGCKTHSYYNIPIYVRLGKLGGFIAGMRELSNPVPAIEEMRQYNLQNPPAEKIDWTKRLPSPRVKPASHFARVVASILCDRPCDRPMTSPDIYTDRIAKVYVQKENLDIETELTRITDMKYGTQYRKRDIFYFPNLAPLIPANKEPITIEPCNKKCWLPLYSESYMDMVKDEMKCFHEAQEGGDAGNRNRLRGIGKYADNDYDDDYEYEYEYEYEPEYEYEYEYEVELDKDGKPIIGPDGKPKLKLGLDGKPILKLGPDGKPIVKIGPDGKPILKFGPDGKPIIKRGKDGKIIYKLGPDGRPILKLGPDGKPILRLGPDGKPIIKRGPDGKIIYKKGPDGKPILKLGKDGKPILKLGPDGKPILKSGPDGKSIKKSGFDRKSVKKLDPDLKTISKHKKDDIGGNNKTLNQKIKGNNSNQPLEKQRYKADNQYKDASVTKRFGYGLNKGKQETGGVPSNAVIPNAKTASGIRKRSFAKQSLFSEQAVLNIGVGDQMDKDEEDEMEPIDEDEDENLGKRRAPKYRSPYGKRIGAHQALYDRNLEEKIKMNRSRDAKALDRLLKEAPLAGELVVAKKIRGDLSGERLYRAKRVKSLDAGRRFKLRGSLGGLRKNSDDRNVSKRKSILKKDQGPEKSVSVFTSNINRQSMADEDGVIDVLKEIQKNSTSFGAFDGGDKLLGLGYRDQNKKTGKLLLPLLNPSVGDGEIPKLPSINLNIKPLSPTVQDPASSKDIKGGFSKTYFHSTERANERKNSVKDKLNSPQPKVTSSLSRLPKTNYSKSKSSEIKSDSLPRVQGSNQYGRNKISITKSDLLLNNRSDEIRTDNNRFVISKQENIKLKTGYLDIGHSGLGNGPVDLELRTFNTGWNIASDLFKKPIKAIVIPPQENLLAHIEKVFPGNKWPRGNPVGFRYYPNGSVFCAAFEDGSGEVFYPHGGLAIVVSAPNPVNKVLVIRDPYDKFYLMDKAILANLDCDGRGTVFNDDGVISLQYNTVGGFRLDGKDQHPTRWMWNRGGQRIILKLNRYMSLRMLDLNRIHLVFNGNKRGVRFNVGPGGIINLMSAEPDLKQDSSEFLLGRNTKEIPFFKDNFDYYRARFPTPVLGFFDSTRWPDNLPIDTTICPLDCTLPPDDTCIIPDSCLCDCVK